MIEKILLADSGTGNTEAMMKVLMDIPLIQRAAVTVLHVVPSQVSAETMASKWEEGGRTLATAIQNLNRDPGKVTAVLREGDPKDVVVQVEACGVCMHDVAVRNGTLKRGVQLPTILGHEVSGTVVAVGAKVPADVRLAALMGSVLRVDQVRG